MKALTPLFGFAVVALLSLGNATDLFSQNMGINYQAVIRDAQGNLLVRKPVDVKFELVVQGQPQTQPPAYAETHSGLQTDAFGSFSAVIGNGAREGSSPAFSALDFRSNWYRVRVSFRLGGGQWLVINEQALQAVPYALNSYEPPIGTIQQFGGTKEYFDRVMKPQGWRICDGEQFDISSSPANQALFDAIRHSWGTGQGNNRSKFRLPDLRGRFLRAVDDRAGNDPDTSTRTRLNQGEAYLGDLVGSVQPDAFQGHWHETQITRHDWGPAPMNTPTLQYTNGKPPADWGVAGPYSNPPNNTNVRTRKPIADGSGESPRTSVETRPENAYVYMIIYVGRGVK